MIPGGHRCPETTHHFGTPVKCRRTAGHDKGPEGTKHQAEHNGSVVEWKVVP